MMLLLMFAVATDKRTTFSLNDLGDKAFVECGVFDRTGSRLALGLTNGEAIVVEAGNGKIIARREVLPGASIPSIAFGNRDDSVAVGLSDENVVGLGKKGLQQTDALDDIYLYKLRAQEEKPEFNPIGKFPKGWRCVCSSLSFTNDDERIVAFLQWRPGNSNAICKGSIAVHDIRAMSTTWYDSGHDFRVHSKVARFDGKDVVAVSEIMNPKHEIDEEGISGVSLVNIGTGVKSKVGEVAGEIKALAFGERTVFAIAIEFITPEMEPRYRLVRWLMTGGKLAESIPLNDSAWEVVSSRHCLAARRKDGKIVLWSGDVGEKPKTADPGSSTARVLCVSNQGRVALMEKGRVITIVTPQ